MAFENAVKTITEIESHMDLYIASLDALKNHLDKIENEAALYQNFTVDNFDDFKTQINLTGFLTLSLLDLLVISKNMMLTKYKWEQIHQIRLGYLLIYSVIETYNLHGKQLKVSSEKNSKLKELFELITTDLKTFKKQHAYPTTFEKIRNSTIGHIDPDFKIYYDTITKIDAIKSYNTILDFMLILYKLQEFGKENSNTLTLKVGNEIYTIEEYEAEQLKARNQNCR
jgi:hypothetical protein